MSQMVVKAFVLCDEIADSPNVVRWRMADRPTIRRRLSRKEVAVNPQNKTVEPRRSFTFEAIPEDEETQNELNRRLRNPGEPGYCASSKNGEASNTNPAGDADSQ